MKEKHGSRWIRCTNHKPGEGAQNIAYLAVLLLLCSASGVFAQMKLVNLWVAKCPPRIGPDRIYSGIGTEKEVS